MVMWICIILGFVLMLFIFVGIPLLSFMWFNDWVKTLPPEEQKMAWDDYNWLSMAETPEEQAMILYHIRERRKSENI